MNIVLRSSVVLALATATVSDKWKVSTRLDGAWGDTDGTINASVMASRRMGNGS